MTPPACLRAVLFDRDGTLVHDVPHNGDPAAVRPVDGAAEALARVRAAGLATAVVTNQGGIGLGLLTRAQVDAVHARIDALLGPLGPWLVCEHAPGAGCTCRKPAPGLVLQAAAALGVRPEECAVVGDLGEAVDAALAAQPEVAAKVRGGKVQAVGALVGAVMKATRGQADAAVVRRLLLERLGVEA